MSWESLETKAPNPEATEKAGKADAAVNKCCSHLSRSEYTPLVGYLRKVAYSRSFRPGRPAEDTAWAEGYRALAVELLSRGGILDG